MKHFVIILGILASLTFSNIVNANAVSSYSLEELKENQADYLEIINLSQSIIDMINNIRSNDQLELLPDDFQIDFESAQKIYVDTDIFSLDTSNRDEIMDSLNNSTYVWSLLVHFDNSTYKVCIAKGLPLDESVTGMLTNEEIQYIKANEGKWSISGIEIFKEDIIDYEEIINSNINSLDYENNSEIVFCGGLDHIFQPVALVMNEEKIEYLIPLYDLTIEGTPNQIKSIKPEKAHLDDEVYLYSKIRDVSKKMGNNDKNYSGGTSYINLTSNTTTKNTSRIILLSAVTFLICIGIIFVMRKHKLIKR